MKSIVMEVDGRDAVVMNGAGDFIRIKNRNYRVGQRIEARRVPRLRRMRTAIAAAAAVLILFAAGGTYAYLAPYSEVSLDVNPSIMLRLNYFNRVIDVDAMNDEARRVLEGLELINDDVETATGEVVDALSEKGYIKAGADAEFMVTANSQDQTRAREMLEAAERRIEQRTEEHRIRANVSGECIGRELVTRAREYGVSPGKLRLVEKYALSTGDPSSVDVAGWLEKPVKEIMAATRENRKDTKGSNAPGNGAANGKGNAGDADASNGKSGNSDAGNGDNGAGNNDGVGNGSYKSNGSNGNIGSATAAPSATPGAKSGDASQNGAGNGRPSAAPNPARMPVCSPVCTGDAEQNRHQNGPNNGNGNGPN
ncbi:MAG: anti-sigma factor domain-containing protein [Christensenellales bacterium]|jgi:hypothetical protein